MLPQKGAKRKQWMVRPVAALIIGCALVALAGCFAAIPVAIVAYEDDHRYTATADVKAKPADVYDAANQVVTADSSLKVVKKDDKSLLLEADKGTQFISIKAAALPDGNTQLVVLADKTGKAEDRTTATDLVKVICDKLGVTYSLVKS